MFRKVTASGGVAAFTRSDLLRSVVNLQANKLPFQTHHAQFLLDEAKRCTPKEYAKFLENPQRNLTFASKEFVDTRLKAPVDAHEFTLPLPKHMINPKEAPEDVLQARTFRVVPFSAEVKKLIEKLEGESKFIYPWPRCGETGIFFRREELVDNLCQAAVELRFASPFWIRNTHPQLGKFLLLKEGSLTISISCTAAVTPISSLASVPYTLIHPKLQNQKFLNQQAGATTPESPYNTAQVPRGFNAFTGSITANHWVVEQMPDNGVWISHEQFVEHNLLLRPGLTEATAFTEVEIDQWLFHNADQLVTPGRLALAKAVALDGAVKDTTEVFH
jgi:hypothetical protein